METILITGATGGLGAWLLYLSTQVEPYCQQYKVRALVRDVERAKDRFKKYGIIKGDEPSFEMVKGDVRDMESLEKAVEGIDYLICAVGVGYSVDGGVGSKVSRGADEFGTKNQAEACKKEKEKSGKFKKFVLYSSAFVTRPDSNVYKLLNTMFDNNLVWKLRGENHLRASGLNYTIIRPGNLGNFPYPENEKSFTEVPSYQKQKKLFKIQVSQGDFETGTSSRKECAILGLEALKSSLTDETSFETFLVEGDPTLRENIEEQFFKPLIKEKEKMPLVILEDEENGAKCNVCQASFGMFKWRYSCFHCGKPCCADHLTEKPIPQYGLPKPKRVCKTCGDNL